MDLNQWLQVFSNVPALIFVFWLSQRMTTHTIPRLANGFQDGLKLQRDDFRGMLEQQRKDFANQLERERQTHQTQIDQLIRLVGDGKPKQ